MTLPHREYKILMTISSQASQLNHIIVVISAFHAVLVKVMHATIIHAHMPLQVCELGMGLCVQTMHRT